MAAILRICLILAAASVSGAQTCTYKFTLTSTWDDGLGNEHFSPFAGVTYVPNSFASVTTAVLFSSGSLASTGIKNLAETGSSTVLETEAAALIAAGTANQFFKSSSGLFTPGTLSFNITVTQPFTSVQMVSMFAPSPDWFTGINANLVDSSGNFLPSVVIDPVNGYDAGTDSGTTFTAANDATIPPVAISRLAAGTINPSTGTATFTALCATSSSVATSPGYGILGALLMMALVFTR